MSKAIRLVCTYENEKLTVTAIDHLEMLTQESDPLDGFENLTGFWLELRTKEGKVRYRQIMRDPFQPFQESYDPSNKDAPIQMVARPEVAGHLVLLVPAIPEADQLALVRSTPDESGQKLNVVDVVNLSLPQEGVQNGKG